MRRRAFISLIGGAVAAWPVAARGEQRMRRIGVLNTLTVEDAAANARYGAFLQGLQQAGWSIGRNVQVETRWAAGDADRLRTYSAELVALAPDVILATGSPTVEPLMRATRTVPIVFVQMTDPVGGGAVESLARPGGNATGFTNAEYGMSGKWLELLKEIAPGVKRAAVLRDTNPTGIGQFAAIQAVAPSLGVALRPLGAGNLGEIERMIAAFAREPNGALIVTPSGLSIVHRDPIIALAARHRLPAIYGLRAFVTDGGLISYGANAIEPYRGAAGYVDRILKGEKPGDLPVQAPNKFELVINLKTAKALGLEVPPTLLARADEVIE
jgi:putative tryptophan/tyrosine transport system substrate-binding protein